MRLWPRDGRQYVLDDVHFEFRHGAGEPDRYLLTGTDEQNNRRRLEAAPTVLVDRRVTDYSALYATIAFGVVLVLLATPFVVYGVVCTFDEINC